MQQLSDCDFTVWNKPLKEKCPKCGASFLLEKVTKRHGRQVLCHTETATTCEARSSPQSRTRSSQRRSVDYGETMVRIIGGGLAGSEAAWQLASRGLPVTLHEMRPVRATRVHKTDRLAELVCSNSFRGNKLENAVGLLKEEMRRIGSLVMCVASETSVPAGAALAVDRHRFR